MAGRGSKAPLRMSRDDRVIEIRTTGETNQRVLTRYITKRFFTRYEVETAAQEWAASQGITEPIEVRAYPAFEQSEPAAAE